MKRITYYEVGGPERGALLEDMFKADPLRAASAKTLIIFCTGAERRDFTVWQKLLSRVPSLSKLDLSVESWGWPAATNFLDISKGLRCLLALEELDIGFHDRSEDGPIHLDYDL
jgi:hypothetical protein